MTKLTVSKVFRDQVSGCSDTKEIQLPESSETVWQFLHLTKKNNLILNLESWASDVLDLALFLAKYRCWTAYEVLVSVNFRSQTNKPFRPFVLFLIGVCGADYQLCARALDMEPQTWNSCDFRWWPRLVADTEINMLHPHALPPWLYCEIPHNILWALNQLFLLNDQSEDHTNLGERFLKLVEPHA